MRQVLARKTILEVRVPHSLDFYSQMDRAGKQLLVGDYADWQRSPLWLEIQDRKAHRRIRLEVSRVYFESEVASEVDAEVKHATSLVRKVLESLHVDSVRRIGLRQWFALEFENRSERALIEKLVERFSPKNQLEQIVGMSIDDVAHTFEFKEAGGEVHGRMVLGAMAKNQWRDIVPYVEQPNMGASHLGVSGREDILNALPESFVLVDLDTYRHCAENQPAMTADDAFHQLTRIGSGRRDVVRKLLRFIREGQLS